MLIGVLVVVIRVWGGMPEGVMYAILLGNAVSPHIDSLIRPRVYGTARREKSGMSQLPLVGRRPPAPSVWHMYRAMVGIGMLCGLLIVAVFELTRPVIERNKAEALQRAIFQVLPGGQLEHDLPLDDDERLRVAARARPPGEPTWSTPATTSRSSWSAWPSRPRAWATRT